MKHKHVLQHSHRADAYYCSICGEYIPIDACDDDAYELHGSRTAALKTAYAALDKEQRALIGKMIKQLRAMLHQRCADLKASDAVCLDILAAIGQVLNKRMALGAYDRHKEM